MSLQIVSCLGNEMLPVSDNPVKCGTRGIGFSWYALGLAGRVH